MKKKLLLPFLLLVLFASVSNAQNCASPTSSAVYQNGFNSVAVQQNDHAKLVTAVRFISDKCLLSAQVKNMAMLFSADSVRMEFCKTAWPHTYDPGNFYDVYDAFHSFSYALRLYNFVQSNPVAAVVVQNTTIVTPPPGPVYPNYAYPDTTHYTGKKGCAGPAMNETAFKQSAQNVFAQPTDESKFIAIQSVYEQNCLTFAQAMKLASMLQTDNFKMKTLMNSFPKVYDQEHYQSGIVLFSTTQAQNEWINYAKTYLTPPVPECVTNDADFKSVLNSVHSKNFPADKMSTLELAAKDRCFTVEQIRKFSLEFSFGDDKLKVFKMLYAKCNDKNNYYKLMDELTFSSEKDELKKFINNGGH